MQRSGFIFLLLDRSARSVLCQRSDLLPVKKSLFFFFPDIISEICRKNCIGHGFDV